jgi:hypothetical protein
MWRTTTRRLDHALGLVQCDSCSWVLRCAIHTRCIGCKAPKPCDGSCPRDFNCKAFLLKGSDGPRVYTR